MSVLKQGSSGPDVTALQTRLKDLGFDPNGVDGNFGPGTKAALIAFQKSKGLTADGVAGPQTMGALQLGTAAAAGANTSTTTSTGDSVGGGAAAASAPAVAGVTAENVSKMFPGVPITNIKE